MNYNDPILHIFTPVVHLCELNEVCTHIVDKHELDMLLYQQMSAKVCASQVKEENSYAKRLYAGP